MYGGIAGQSVFRFGATWCAAIDGSCGCAAANFHEDGLLLLAGSREDKTAVGVGEGSIFTDKAFRCDTQLQRVGQLTPFVSERFAIARALHLVAYHLIASKVAHHLVEFAQCGESPSFGLCLPCSSVGVVYIVVVDHHGDVGRLVVLLGIGPVGRLVFIEDGYSLLAFQVFCHPQHAASFDDGIAVA